MLDVIMRLGETAFQSREVIGAVCSGDLELERRASGESFCVAWPLTLFERPRVFVLYGLWWSVGKDQRRRWSPEVASRSVDCF